jgi:hypothetical protein
MKLNRPQNKGRFGYTGLNEFRWVKQSHVLFQRRLLESSGLDANILVLK